MIFIAVDLVKNYTAAAGTLIDLWQQRPVAGVARAILECERGCIYRVLHFYVINGMLMVSSVCVREVLWATYLWPSAIYIGVLDL